MSCAERVNPCVCRICNKSVSRFPSAYYPPPTTMKLHRLLVPLALLTVAASAQTTVYSTNFSSGALRTSGSTYNTGDWTLAASKSATSSSGSSSPSLSTSGLDFGMASTTSNVIQTQNRFTSSSVTLPNTNDYIQLRVVFTDKNNILGGNSSTSSQLSLGLYDTSGNNPAIGLSSSPLLSSTASSSFATGNAATWEGYLGRFTLNAGSNVLQARPVQNGISTGSANQDLLFNGVSAGFNNPGPSGILNVSSASTLGTLSNNSQYSATLKITRSETAIYTIQYSLFDGSSNQLQSVSTTATGTGFLSNLSFDGLAVGYRFATPTGQGQVSGLAITSVQVTNYSAVPEPANVAALIGLAGLAAVGLRRKNKA